ncbi:FHA domain-containing protein [Caldalkalibacillus mannanilyticus]|uniref:FHA domain-containing protein n=1 Tax=Caldalkalibacillus mannanilyticus TaxID=1418 RepID=UPI00046AE464|nr:FHA domain-containing protein [Caldalkalibacillus mannanilyticus]
MNRFIVIACLLLLVLGLLPLKGYAQKIEPLNIVSAQYMELTQTLVLRAEKVEEVFRPFDQVHITMNDQYIQGASVRVVLEQYWIEVPQVTMEQWKEADYIAVQLEREEIVWQGKIDIQASKQDKEKSPSKDWTANRLYVGLGVLGLFLLLACYWIGIRWSKKPRIRAEIAFLTNQDTGEVYRFKGNISLGRSTSNDVMLKDEGVSLFHAQVLEQNAHYYVLDLESSNGISVNGRKIKPQHKHKLKNGDELTIGVHTYRFREGEEK